MKRSDLIKKISENYPYMSKKNIDQFLTIVIDSIVNALKDNNRVELRGFGTFSVRERGKSVVRNPKTGEKLNVDSKKIPFFKSGKQLKDLVNGRISFTDENDSEE